MSLSKPTDIPSSPEARATMAQEYRQRYQKNLASVRRARNKEQYAQIEFYSQKEFVDASYYDCSLEESLQRADGLITRLENPTDACDGFTLATLEDVMGEIVFYTSLYASEVEPLRAYADERILQGKSKSDRKRPRTDFDTFSAGAEEEKEDSDRTDSEETATTAAATPPPPTVDSTTPLRPKRIRVSWFYDSSDDEK